MNLEDIEMHLRNFLLQIRTEKPAGLSPKADSHLTTALAFLDAAHAQIDVAQQFQAEALAALR